MKAAVAVNKDPGWSKSNIALLAPDGESDSLSLRESDRADLATCFNVCSPIVEMAH